MFKYMLQLFLVLALCVTIIQAINDEYLVQSDYLPDLSQTPTLANGHLGYGFLSQRIELNCLFNGRGGGSELARIPNWGNIKVEKVFDSNQKDHMFNSKTLYTMNTRTGVFEWETNIPSFSLKLIQKTYAHRFYNRGIIYELQVQRTNAEEPLQLLVTQLPGPVSNDMNLYITTNTSQWRIIKGITKNVENEEFQENVKTVFIVQSEYLEKGKILEINRGQLELNYKFILTVDENEEVAKKEAKKLMALSSEQIMDEHVKEWESFWQSFNIEISGNLELSQIVNAGMFYMASALPSLNSFQPNNEFCGLSPNGIGRGRNNNNVGERGHTFWDTEYLMLPVVTHFSNSWARELFKYRKNRLPAARLNANKTSNRGAKFPWRSAYTGIEVLYSRHIYISPGIVAAVKHHFAVTNDKLWLCESAWPMVQEIAEFLVSRVSWNPLSAQYHIRDVYSPGLEKNVNDSTYTNAVFKIGLEFASYTQNICEHRKNNATTIWNTIARNIFIPYDSVLDYHPQSPDYNINDTIVGPDVVLLGYPLQYDMKISTRINDVNIYEAVTTDSHSRTCPIYATNLLDVNEKEKADFYFRKSYKNYVLKEFKLWNRGLSQYVASNNFHTGFASFFQSIMNGYAGIRFHNYEEKSIMEIGKRYLLPDTKSFKIHGISFAESAFDLSIDGTENATLTCVHLGGKSLELIQEDKKERIYKGLSINLGSSIAFIQTD